MKLLSWMMVTVAVLMSSVSQAAVVFGISETKDLSGYSGTLLTVNGGVFRYEEVETVREGGDLIRLTLERTVAMGITGITWKEDKNKPCKISLKTSALDTSIDKQYTKTEDICAGRSGNRKTVKFSASREFLRGIAVCTNNKKNSSKNRLKGIRIYPARVDANGSVTNIDTYEQTRHTNCPRNGNMWFDPVFCSDGYIATGVRVFHNGDTFRGLGLRCRRVDTANSPYIR